MKLAKHLFLSHSVCALTILCSLLILGVALAQADENFSGAYTSPGTAKGPAMTLIVQQDEQGNATGTLTSSGNVNAPMQLRGKLLEKQGDKQPLMGRLQVANGPGLFFLMERLNGKISFSFIPPDANGNPDFQHMHPQIFSPMGKGANQNPGGTLNPPDNNPTAARTRPYTGTFKNGALTLSLQQEGETYKGTLVGNGVIYNLEGSLEANGGLFGKLKTPGEGTNYFKLQKQNNQLVLTMIKAGADGDPDYNQKNDVNFPAEGATVTTTNGDNAGNPARNDPYSGTFKSNEMVIQSQRAGEGYTGTIQFGGQTYDFTAHEQGGELAGQFKTNDGQFDFTAQLQGTTLSLTTGGATHTLAKQGRNPLADVQPVNPLGNAQPANPLATGDRPPADAAPDWKVYNNALGISLKYPATWIIREAPGGGFLLVPPDTAMGAQGPLEAYMGIIAPAGAVKTLDDPRVIQALDMQMRAISPTLKRTGNTERLKVGNTTGIGLRWTARNPATQMEVNAQLYTTLLNGNIVALAAMGAKDRIAARDKTLHDIFASLSVPNPGG